MTPAGYFMGFALTLLYILTAYLSPGILFGPLAQYHLEIIIAAAALLASVPSLSGSGILRAPQTLAIVGMAFSIVVSLMLTGWIGGAPAALYEFLPDSFAFFLIAVNCRTRRRLQFVVLTLVLGSCFYIVQGALALHAGEIVSPYLYDQGYEGTHIMRIRGLSIVNDPNDFAQVLVSLIPCMFLFWKPKSIFWNVPAVVLPCSFLLVGVFLTHSRGSLLALMAVIAVSVYRRFGAIAAGIMAVATYAVSTALSWSGGREINAEAGADRMDAWATGLEMIKSHPVFGVGYRRFTEYNPITAHNTIVVCAAELGFVGFFFWVLFVVSSIREGIILRTRPLGKTASDDSSARFRYAPAALQYRTAGGLAPDTLMMSADAARMTGAERGASLGRAAPLEEEPAGRETEAGIRQMAWVMVVCFAGFLVAGWFLSRAYVMWLFIYGGMTHVIYSMALERGIAPPPISLPRLMRTALIVAIGLLLLVYIILRAKRFLPGA